MEDIIGAVGSDPSSVDITSKAEPLLSSEHSQTKSSGSEPSTSVEPNDSQGATIDLQFGYLVRVTEDAAEKSPLLDDRRGQLGRVSQCNPNNTFDVEWILGGCSKDLERSCLIRATSTEEGIADESFGHKRRRRVRKQPDMIDPTPPKRKATKKPSPPKKKKGQPKKAPPKKTVKTKSCPKPNAKKPGPAKKTTKKAAAASTASSATKLKVAPSVKKRKLEDTKPAAQPKPNFELFERHRREFERIVTRLEKVDQFGWFHDPVPDEYDEVYCSKDTKEPAVSTLESVGVSTDDVKIEEKGGVLSHGPHMNRKKGNNGSKYPSHPPYNWEIVRRRMEQGRYELDRIAAEEKERFRILGTYYQSIKKKAPRKAKSDGNAKATRRVLHPLGVHWDLFKDDVVAMCKMAMEREDDEDADCRGSLTSSATKVMEATLQAYEKTGKRHLSEMNVADLRHKFGKAVELNTNKEAAMQSWRKSEFPERRYERLSSDKVCAGLSPMDEQIANYELRTNLVDSFVGISYRYDDTGQSEAWMKSIVDETGSNTERSKSTSRERQAALALAADDGVTRAQVNATMQTLLIGVQDKVMTETGVLNQPELRSANWAAGDTSRQEDNVNPALVEQPVWGVDCYTRRNISTCLETEFDKDTALQFIEKWLLPAINACPSKIAHNLTNAARILEGLMPQDSEERGTGVEASESVDNGTQTLLGRALQKKIQASAPTWLKGAAYTLRKAYEVLGRDFFRVHPKGHGSVLLSQRVPPNSLVTFYRGEVYPSWRWGEKMDAIDITQDRKSLKPALPDFYNMALERPQVDPRGYGLLFVDASRKAGHGSSLSHSCAPTCEVRVAAVNGELTLAMATLRELEMGEELTFDYNAVTESLNEYSSAVCLCGYGKCRGSFLHFATADCYQSVLNRNAPIATRFSNLVKGSMKQVMSEEDTKVLKSHGFRTAAFGAISVNRRKLTVESRNAVLDSIDIVPVWLRTYVADTLRYIEYERRALPIALICDHLSTSKKKGKTAKVANEAVIPAVTAKEPKEEPAFFYFVRLEKERIKKMLLQEGIPESINGVQLNHAVKKVGSGYWKSLSESKKTEWKKKASDEFNRRHKDWQKRSGLKGGEKSDKKNAKNMMNMTDLLSKSDISFQDADAEGVSAMEQRIQQLTQALSRVGRVLDRHREWKIKNKSENTSSLGSDPDATHLRSDAHAPITVCPDNMVIDWIWNSPGGVLASLLRCVDEANFTRPELLENLNTVKSKYDCLTICGTSSEENNTPAVLDMSQGRRQLSEALLECRQTILEELKEMGRVHSRYRKALLKTAREGSTASEAKAGTSTSEDDPPPPSAEKETVGDKAHDCAADDAASDVTVDVESVEGTISALLEDMISEVESRAGAKYSSKTPSPTHSIDTKKEREKLKRSEMSPKKTLKKNPWLKFYSRRFALQTTADLLLFYAHTKAFFMIKPYRELKSTPIEVYARELGNEVPVSAIDKSVATRNSAIASSTSASENQVANDAFPASELPSLPTKAKLPDPRCDEKDDDKAGLCLPDDVVAEVTITYKDDYILSQLLQWYNGGIGQKQGLPDMIGCAHLPSITGCFSCELLSDVKDKVERRTQYEGKVRPKLIEWLQDPYQRGSPWPSEVKAAFEQKGITASASMLFGCPVLDFLVTGDESSIFETLAQLDAENKVASNSSSDGFLSSVDKGRPAQAVSTWVQCENADCLKWRKIPWHVDIDLLPEKFFCEDNVWNPNGNSCKKAEDDWDKDDAMVGPDGKVEGSPVRKRKHAELSPTEESSFTIGARFDVERNGKYVCGTVLKVDFSGMVKRIFFRFAKTSSKYDEWIEFKSPRIFTRNTMVDVAPKLKKSKDPPIKMSKTVKSSKVEAKDETKRSNVKPFSASTIEQPVQPPSVVKTAGAMDLAPTDLVGPPNEVTGANGKLASTANTLVMEKTDEKPSFTEMGIPAIPKPKLATISSSGPPHHLNEPTREQVSGSLMRSTQIPDVKEAPKDLAETTSAAKYSQQNPPVVLAPSLNGAFESVPAQPPLPTIQSLVQGNPLDGATSLTAQIQWLLNNGYNIPNEWQQVYRAMQQLSWQAQAWQNGNP